MKKFQVFFFLLLIALPYNAFAQTSAALTVASDFRVSKILDNLPAANSFTFDFEGNFIIVENANNSYRIIKVNPEGESTTLLDRQTEPILGISYHSGNLYVVTRGKISILKKGHLQDIIAGLPAYGDYANSPVIFENGKMYFSVGTATNSGFVGSDNAWLPAQPSVHDLPCADLKVNQVNITTDNFLTKNPADKAITGSFMPFNTPDYSDTLSGSFKCNGAILSAAADGSDLQVVAYGFHNPKGLSFDNKGQLYTLDTAMEDRGVRPIKDGKDAVYQVSDKNWYGWPDFNAGSKLDTPLLKEDPGVPPAPLSKFDPGHLSQFLISQFDSQQGLAIADGSKVVQFKLGSDEVSDFASFTPASFINQIKFGPDGNLYILSRSGKTSQLWMVDPINPKTTPLVTSSVGGVRTLPTSWALSLAVMFIGLLATYLVYHNQQRAVL